MALLLRSCLLHRTMRSVKEVIAVKYNFSSLQHIRNHIEPKSFIRAQAFSTSKVLAKDETTKDQILIYEGPLSKKMRFIKLFSLTTSAGGLLLQPYLIQSAAQNNDMMGVMGVSLIFLIFTLGSPLGIHWLAKRYVTRVYYDEKKDEYTACSLSFWVRNKELKFQAKDAKPLELTGMFTTCEIKGKHLFLDRQNFADPTYYDKIMGFEYDKVFPLNIGEADAEILDKNDQHPEKMGNSNNHRHVYENKNN